MAAPSRPWPAALALAALVLGGCGGGAPASTHPRAGESPGTTAPGASAGGIPELTEITVGTLPIVDVAPVHLAINAGLFAAEGLTVTPEVMQGGAAAIPALQGGDLDVAYGAWPSFLIANSSGIDLRAVADGVAASPGFIEYLVLPGSTMAGSPEELAGATIALNTLGNIGELATRITLDNAGLAWEDVTAIELPFPDMGAALEGGTVDVIWAVEPGVTATKSSLGAVTVVDSFVGALEGFPVAGYMVTAEFAAANPNTVAAFRRALQAAVDMIAADPQLAIDTVLTYTELPPELVERLSFPEYRATLDAAVLHRVYDTMLAYGMGQEGLDVDSLVLGRD
jgi:NitT/TauT family transport system substrate-binding protein